MRCVDFTPPSFLTISTAVFTSSASIAHEVSPSCVKFIRIDETVIAAKELPHQFVHETLLPQRAHITHRHAVDTEQICCNVCPVTTANIF